MGKKKPPKKPRAVEVLTPAQELFCREWCVDFNATRAYRVAFPGSTYQTAKTEGPKLLAKPHIKSETSAVRSAQRKRIGVRADAVIEEARRLAFSDPIYLFEDDGVTPRGMRHIPPETRAAIASVKVRRERVERHRADGDTEVVTTHEVIEFKLWPKPKGIDKLWVHLGLKTEITPLDALLAALPPGLAEQVRLALAGGVK